MGFCALLAWKLILSMRLATEMSSAHVDARINGMHTISAMIDLKTSAYAPSGLVVILYSFVL